MSVGSADGVAVGSGVAVSVGRGVPEGRMPVKVAVATVVGLTVVEGVAVRARVAVTVGEIRGFGVGSTGNAELLLSNKKPMAYKGKVRMKIPKYSPRR